MPDHHSATRSDPDATAKTFVAAAVDSVCKPVPPCRRSCPRVVSPCHPRLLFLAVAALALAGCGSSDSERSRVRGAVSYDGQPVDEGSIGFIPEGAGQSQVPA